MTSTIRPARESDVPALTDLCTQLGYPSTPEQVTHRLTEILPRPDHIVFVAEIAGKPVGWAHVNLVPVMVLDRLAELAGLVVDKNCRRSGVGRALLSAAEDWARQRGCAELWLRSNVIRTQAHQFYESLGYQRIKSQFTFVKILAQPWNDQQPGP
ncbi:MAG: GNAT family N-acetyltransferase [Anaerolineales bacterium]|nr:GNAT family N-acetyltransferase [Anaerolineales bacterium]